MQADLDRRELLHELVAAETDPLTGARTRTAGLADLTHEIERARRTSGLLTLAYIDVVGLKAVNDTFGHAAGDALLRRTAGGIRSHLRAYDLIARVGGDEFLCALAGATLRDAHARFAVIRADLAAAADPSEIKAGFAQLEPHESAAALIARADADLPTSVTREGPGDPAGANAQALGRSERHQDAAGAEAGRSSGGDGLPMNHRPHDSSGDSNARGAVTPMDPDGCTARHRVLVADDDPVVQSSLRMSLAAGFEVVGVASDSEQAIGLATATKPDAAIVDVNMPGGGLRAVQGIHETSPATAIVILSSDELSGVVRELLLAGATTYCRKGVAPEVLGELLTRSIRARAGEIAAQAAVGEPAAQV
jgi:diguanylate cyclase (GGDEF)-like protein